MKIGEIRDSLSPIRREIYDYVWRYEEANGDGATIRDIASHVGLVVSNTYFHVKTLCDLGLLYQNSKRHFRVVGSVVTVVMPDDDTELEDAERLDAYHVTSFSKKQVERRQENGHRDTNDRT